MISIILAVVICNAAQTKCMEYHVDKWAISSEENMRACEASREFYETRPNVLKAACFTVER